MEREDKIREVFKRCRYKYLEDYRKTLCEGLGTEISEKIIIFWWPKIKVNGGKIEVWDIVIDSCNPPRDWKLGKYNIRIDYNWLCLYNWEKCIDRTNLFKLKYNGFIVITETDVNWKVSHRVVEVSRN